MNFVLFFSNLQYILNATGMFNLKETNGRLIKDIVKSN